MTAIGAMGDDNKLRCIRKILHSFLVFFVDFNRQEFFLQIWNGHVQQLRRLLPWFSWGLISFMPIVIFIVVTMVIDSPCTGDTGDTRQTPAWFGLMVLQHLGNLRDRERQWRWIFEWFADDDDHRGYDDYHCDLLSSVVKICRLK